MKIGCDIKVQKIYPSGKKKQIKKKIKLKMDTSLPQKILGGN